MLLILYYYHGWVRLEEVELEGALLKTKVTVVIPARNEEQNIKACIQSILNQNYSKELIEVIVINDHSTDNTRRIVDAFDVEQVKVFDLQDLLQSSQPEIAYKKRAIELAVEKAAGDLIITTDADCISGKNWITSIVEVYEKEDYKLIAAPVVFRNNNSLFEKFQALDFISMIGITAASINKGFFNLANGANLAYEKKAFEEVSGYKDIDHKASGDDMLLIYKIAHHFKEKVAFLKNREAIVSTNALPNLNEFIQQRFRWTSKSFSYQDKRITFILGMVYFFNVTLLVNLLLCLMDKLDWYFLLAQLGFKMFVDFLFLFKVSDFFSSRKLMRIFAVSQVLHIIYIVAIGALGNILQYNWKGRKLK